MASIIPRINPGESLPSLNALPGVRNTTHVESNAEGILAGTRAFQEGGALLRDHYEQKRAEEETTVLMKARRELSDFEHATFDDPNNADGLYAYRGDKALQAHDALLPKVDAQIASIRSRLSGATAQRFDAVAEGWRESIQRSQIDPWVQREHDAYTAGEREAFASNLTNDAVRAGLDGNFGLAAQRAQELITAQTADMATRGAGPERIKLAKRSLSSNIYSGIARGMVLEDPIKAVAFFDRYEGQMDEQDRLQVEGTLRPYVEDAQADAYADWVENGGDMPHDATRETLPQAAVAPRGQPSPEIRSAIDVAADKHGVPRKYLYALAEQESSFNPNARGTQLDDGDHATGLFQYRASTAKGLGGFDRTDPVSSADAAARQFRERMDAHGPTFAIAAHFAGDDTRIHGPKTRAYVGEVQARAQRWDSESHAQGAMSSPVNTVSSTVSSENAEARLEEISNPRMRRLAEARWRDRQRQQKQDEADAKQAALERMNTAIENADPTLPVRQALGADFALAASLGVVDSYETRLKQRRAGVVPVSDPLVLSSLQEGVYRAMRGGEPAQAALRALNPYDPALKLAPEDRAWLADKQLTLLSGDAKKMSHAASEGETTRLITQYRVQTLGIDDKVVKTPDGQARAIAFDQSMRTWAAQFEEKNNRGPSYTELTEHADELTLAGLGFTLNVPGRFWGTNPKSQTVADLHIPADKQAQIAEALRLEGRPVTGTNIASKWQAYLRIQK